MDIVCFMQIKTAELVPHLYELKVRDSLQIKLGDLPMIRSHLVIESGDQSIPPLSYEMYCKLQCSYPRVYYHLVVRLDT